MIPDDTKIILLKMETEIKALKEELLLMKKNHEEEVNGLHIRLLEKINEKNDIV